MDDDTRYRVHDATTCLTTLARTPLWWAFPASARARLMNASTALFEVANLDGVDALSSVRDTIDGLLEATTGPPLFRIWNLFGRRTELRKAASVLGALDAELQARPRGAIPQLDDDDEPRSERARIPRQSPTRNISAG